MTVPATEVEAPRDAGHSRHGGGMGRVRRGLRETGLALITAGVILLLFVAYQLWGTGIFEAHKQASLKKAFDSQVAARADNPAVGSSTVRSTGPSLPGAPPGGAIDHMVIPRIGLDKYVVQGVDDNDLREGPGHYPETVLPGQKGNAAIAGHRTTYGAPFFDLNELTTGDVIYITNLDGKQFTYRVSRAPEVVSPSDVAVLDNTPFPQLTLTTCNPRFSDTSRLIVFARLVGNPVPGITRVPATSPAAATPVTPAAAADETLGSGNTNAWPAVLGYGALVVILWIGVRILINRTRRWTRVGAYVGGIALCLVPLWFLFENVVLLLPQNI